MNGARSCSRCCFSSRCLINAYPLTLEFTLALTPFMEPDAPLFYLSNPVPLSLLTMPLTQLFPHAQSITAVVLAGGQGTRMGGVDKGLQHFQGQAMAQRALLRVAPWVGTVAVNANRNETAYQAFCDAIWPDPDLSAWGGMGDGVSWGPLAGFLTALQHVQTPFLLTVPCDCPFFPLDLVLRLSQAMGQSGADLVMPRVPIGREGRQRLATQPVFALMRVHVLKSLEIFMAQGGRKVLDWSQSLHHAFVDFDQAHDEAHAFSNINTLSELSHWNTASPPGPKSSPCARPSA